MNVYNMIMICLNENTFVSIFKTDFFNALHYISRLLLHPELIFIRNTGSDYLKVD